MMNFLLLMVTIYLFPQACWFVNGIKSLSSSDCGKSKTCFREPAACDPNGGCTFFSSWKSESNYIEIELAGSLEDRKYIAIGYSLDKLMGDDGVTACYLDSGSVIQYFNGYTTGTVPPTSVTPASGYLVTSGVMSGSDQLLGGSFDSSKKYMTCRFRRLAKPTNTKLKDLSTGVYYVLIAMGPMTSASVLGNHQSNKWISPESYNFLKVSNETVIDSGFSLSKNFKAVSDQGCGVHKSCFKASDGAFLSWRVEGGMLEMEMSGNVGKAGGYIAFGLSENEAMENDGVIACVSSASGSVTARVAYNIENARLNEYLTKYPSDFVVTSNAMTGSANLLGGSFTASESVVSCRVRRVFSPSSNAGKLKDLSGSKKYFVMMARGTSTSSSGLSKHSPGWAVLTSSPVEMTSKDYVVLGSKSFPLAKAHGSLMIISWLLCTSVGITFARFFKSVWSDRLLGGQKVWFQFHRGLQLTCMFATAIAFILIFVEAKGYTKEKSLPQVAHPILGIIVTILCIANPIIAAFRCGPGTKNRPIFNWSHSIVGYLAYILSIPTIIIGFRMGKAGTEIVTMESPMWIVVSYTIFGVLVNLGFMFTSSCVKADTHSIEMSSQRSSNPEIKNAATADNSKKEKIFKILLGVVVAVAIVCTLVLIILLGIY